MSEKFFSPKKREKSGRIGNLKKISFILSLVDNKKTTICCGLWRSKTQDTSQWGLWIEEE
jgi:hypothetical protein